MSNDESRLTPADVRTHGSSTGSESLWLRIKFREANVSFSFAAKRRLG